MKRMSGYLAVLICVMALAGCATAQRGAMTTARSSINRGKYVSALEALGRAEGYVEPTPGLKAEISFLRAICYEGLGRHNDARGALEYIVDRFPDSSYAYQAKARLQRTGSDSTSKVRRD